MGSLRLLVADDHDVVRRGLCALLSGRPDWSVAGEARNGREAVAMTMNLAPDVAILDISMPDLNGLEAARQIRKSGSKTKVLVLTMHESDTFIGEAIEAGVRGYLLKTNAGKDLVDAVDSLGRNKTFFGSEVSQMIQDGYLKKGMQTEPAASGPRYRLTSRQREIVQLLAEGKSSKEVATILNVSVKTVETHRANIMGRLNCHCVTDLVRYAIRNHIVEP